MRTAIVNTTQRMFLLDTALLADTEVTVLEDDAIWVLVRWSENGQSFQSWIPRDTVTFL